MTVSVRRDAPPAGFAPAGGARPPRRPGSAACCAGSASGGLPYLFLMPALILELLVHFIPMIFGIVISFKQLTLFFIRNWTARRGPGGPTTGSR